MRDTVTVLNKPHSKWPYWVLYIFDDISVSQEDFRHMMMRFKMNGDKIPYVSERQWAQYTNWRGDNQKSQRGILYKFLNEEDRLIFLMQQETGE